MLLPHSGIYMCRQYGRASSHERNRWVPKGEHEHAGPAGTEVSSARYLRSESDPESRSFNHRQHLVATLPAGKLRPLPPARWFQHGKRYFNRWSHVWNISGFHRFGGGHVAPDVHISGLERSSLTAGNTYWLRHWITLARICVLKALRAERNMW